MVTETGRSWPGVAALGGVLGVVSAAAMSKCCGFGVAGVVGRSPIEGWAANPGAPWSAPGVPGMITLGGDLVGEGLTRRCLEATGLAAKVRYSLRVSRAASRRSVALVAAEMLEATSVALWSRSFCWSIAF